MKSITVTQARKNLGDIFGEVSYHKERVVLTNHKKRIAIVPIEDLELLQALEDADDMHEALVSLKEMRTKRTVPYQEMKSRLED